MEQNHIKSLNFPLDSRLDTFFPASLSIYPPNHDTLSRTDINTENPTSHFLQRVGGISSLPFFLFFFSLYDISLRSIEGERVLVLFRLDGYVVLPKGIKISSL